MDPAGEAARHGIDLNKNLAAGTITAAPKQVLAGNGFLNSSADSHSNWMLQQDVFSHTGAGNSSAGQRMTSAGYAFTGAWTWGENIAWSGTTGSLDADAAAAQHHVNLFKSAGHRVNILNDSFRELGVGSLTGQFTSNGTTYNAQMTTQNFAKSGSSVFVTGVSYADANGDQFYSIGEGRGGVPSSSGRTARSWSPARRPGRAAMHWERRSAAMSRSASRAADCPLRQGRWSI